MMWHAPPPTTVAPSVKRRLIAAYYRYIPALAAARAAMIITVSNAARADIMRHLRLPEERIAVTLLAANEAFRPLRDAASHDAVRQAYGVDPGYVLAIGASDPRKNVSAAVEAYARLPQQVRERHHLAIVWAHPQLAESTRQQIARLGLQPQVHLLPSLNMQQLAQVYSAAAIFVFPSRYEGFGLPPLEAMSCGTPVVAANNSAIPEVVGDAGILFETDDIAALAAGMERVLTDPALHRDLAARGLARAAEFSWERCARQTVQAYAQAQDVRKDQLAKAT
jgi:glycosyltransferase involved in cell wall biosynthesis